MFLSDNSSKSKQILTVTVSVIIVVLLCSMYLLFEWQRYQNMASHEAIQLAKSMEALLQYEQISELSGSNEDLIKSDYNLLKRSLEDLKNTSNRIYFAYLLKEQNDHLILLVDSEPPGSDDYSPPGQIFHEAEDDYWQPFITGETIITSPVTDRWGTWISALAPIKDPNSKEVIAVLGIDFSASEWQLNLWEQMIPDIIVVFCIIIISLAFVLMKTQREDLKKLNDKIIMDEILYRSVFEQAPIGIALVHNENFVSQSETGKSNINPIFENILGRTRQELEGLKWTEITHPDDLEEDINNFKKFKENQKNFYSMEKRFIKPDGSSVWTNMSVSPIIGSSNKNDVHLCLLQDISARKLAESHLTESERSKSVLLAHLPGMAYSCKYDSEWTMLFVSEGCYELTGYTPDRLIYNRDLSFNDLISPQYREILSEEWRRVIKEKVSFKYEYEIITASGERKWVLEMGEPIYDEQSNVKVLEGIVLDISDRKGIEDQLKHLLNRTQSMIDNHEASMLLIEPSSGKIIEANKAASSFYGYSKEELLNMTIQDINTLCKEEISDLQKDKFNDKKKKFTFPHRLKSGEIKIVDVYSTPIEYDQHKVLFSIIFDVTKREEIAKQNEFLAYHDFLTGLYNRRFFEEDFERRSDKGDFPIAILVGDMDGFKIFNDTFGHFEGDRILKVAGDRIKSIIGKNDVLARIGGDEFAIIVSGQTETEIKKYLDRLNLLFEDSSENSKKEELITISWGYGIQRDSKDSLDKVFEEAEAFMYNRKFYSSKSIRSNTIDIIMDTLFTKSEREKMHSERVGILAEKIAQKMNLKKSESDKIRVAGYLHDIGKIGIDEPVLNKPYPLDDNEWEMMKLHPAKGAAILENTTEYKDIAYIVLSHHERYDGTGYPNGIKAKEIPLGARIIAIADSFDAITNERPYRKAVDQVTAANELKKYSGKQFDPEIVSVLIDILN